MDRAQSLVRCQLHHHQGMRRESVQLTGQCCVKHVVLGADEVMGLVTGLRIPLPRCPATDISQCRYREFHSLRTGAPRQGEAPELLSVLDNADRWWS